MIDADVLLDALAGRGATDLTGVPCSLLTALINRAAGRYLPATQEGEALAIAAGAWLGGGLGCVLSQNSGLGNMVNPMTSLLHPARIPALLLVTWRGEPGRPDEPQHRLMGEMTRPLLDLMRVESAILEPPLGPALDAAWRSMATRGLPYAFVVPRGTITGGPAEEPPTPRRSCAVLRNPGGGHPPSRMEALQCLLGALPEGAAVVATTGMTSRELYELRDADNHFYLTGAMGSASAVGLGVSLRTARPVVVIDGDGALLMRLGSLATVAAHGGGNLIHVVLDNGVHDSTGGQRTLSGTVDMVAAAAACGYAQAYHCGGLTDLAEAVRAAAGPAFVYQRIRPGTRPGTGRPAMAPDEAARRFRAFVTR
ncbi:MAG: phosphonopyruvate decarboxylase [Actinoplanes sp.]